jgi:hypothetical protein
MKAAAIEVFTIFMRFALLHCIKHRYVPLGDDIYTVVVAG